LEAPSCKGERNPLVGLTCCLRFTAYWGCGKEIKSFPALRLLPATAHSCEHHKQTGGTKAPHAVTELPHGWNNRHGGMACTTGML